MPYHAPIREFQHLLDDVLGFERVAASERFADATPDTVGAVLSEAGKLCEEVLAPLQRIGDTDPARLENGVVRTPKGFAEGYRAIAEGGWIGISAAAEHGGMGLPLSLATCVNEMMASACLALQLNPLLTQGQIEALEHHASDEIRRVYLPRLVSGEWCGTMNLTEPQAGSDVGALKTRAEPNGDGSYGITGQKIYISWGDNDFSGNVCHLVLARLPDGVPGTRGISLFMVPKYLPDGDGAPGPANALRVVSLEHKLGLHGAPTAVMEYDGATGWLIGEPHGGMAAMFTMMNNARLNVGVQGIGAAEGAFQHALAFARERVQGRSRREDATGTIIDHADVRRMLTEMKVETQAARAIGLACAVSTDMATATGEPEWGDRAAFLTPIAKAWGTETGIRVADLGLQVHGGMGYIEETGAAQYFRDVRVTAIYEGTNGIQAMDLVGRKLADGGETALWLLDRAQETAERARASMPELASGLWESAELLRETTEWLVERAPEERNAGAVSYLRAYARVLGAFFHLRSALADEGGRRANLAGFYIRRLLPEHIAHCAQVRAGADDLYGLAPEDLAAA